MNKRVWIINIITNSLMVAFTIVAIILMATGIGGTLSASSWRNLKYFTADSNVLMGLAAAISLFFLIFRKDKTYPAWVSVLKLVATAGVGLTITIVFIYLAPLVGLARLLQRANLFMHLIIPVIALVHFALFEPKIKLKFVYNLFSLIPVTIYGLGYLINVAYNNAYGDFMGADWYGFGQYGLGIGFLFLLGCIAIMFSISIGMYFLHQKTTIKKLHEEKRG